jgi:hypothetical protein
MQDLRALAHVVQSRSEKAMRDAIAALADGTYHGTATNNPLGTPMTYPLALTIKGDEIHLDFAGAPPQLAQGGLNCTLNYTSAHATYPLKCMLTPNVRGNAGCYRPFSIDAPKGSILNCDKPLAVNLRTRTGWYLAPNIFRALSKAAPKQVQAFTGLPVAASVYGRDAQGQTYSDMLFVGGGQGGSAHGDGKSGLLYPTSAANTSIETFEARVPVLVPAAPAAGAAASASASASASSATTGCRPWSRFIRKASTTRSRACSAASPAAARRAACSMRAAPSAGMSAPGPSSRSSIPMRSSNSSWPAAPAMATRPSGPPKPSPATSRSASSRPKRLAATTAPSPTPRPRAPPRPHPASSSPDETSADRRQNPKRGQRGLPS